MVFSSLEFLFFFLPLGMAVYYLLRSRKARNVWLLVISLAFYAWGEPVYIALMVASVIANWAIARAMGPAETTVPSTPSPTPDSPANTRTNRKALLVIAVALNVLTIGFFKYEGFLADSINALVGSDLLPNLHLPLPIGISFYTLQALSYVIDVYRGDVPPQWSLVSLGMYVTFFPQLVAGPIVRYKTIEAQIEHRVETLERFHAGARLFIVGLSKKVLLANVCAILADKMLSMDGPSIGFIGAWGGIIAYTFQMLFDFGGYSDMAIGLGRMMGFEYLRNFNYPYVAKSVGEFWRRWHISLYAFFRDYVYIPLGGSRVSLRRWVFNMAVVWLLTGIWHGAAWHYILWGAYYGVLLICERLVWGKALAKAPSVFRHLYTIALVILGWLIFWVPEGQLLEFAEAMCGKYGLSGSSTLWELTVWAYLPVFVLCVVASMPVIPWAWEHVCSWAEMRVSIGLLAKNGPASIKALATDRLCAMTCSPIDASRRKVVAVMNVAVDAALITLYILSVASIFAGSYNPFIYFQF